MSRPARRRAAQSSPPSPSERSAVPQAAVALSRSKRAGSAPSAASARGSLRISGGRPAEAWATSRLRPAIHAACTRSAGCSRYPPGPGSGRSGLVGVFVGLVGLDELDGVRALGEGTDHGLVRCLLHERLPRLLFFGLALHGPSARGGKEGGIVYRAGSRGYVFDVSARARNRLRDIGEIASLVRTRISAADP